MTPGSNSRSETSGTDRATTRAVVSALEAAAKGIDRQSFDVAAVVEKVGRDPVKLFEWVRDETHFVPYQGLLRGPSGVLMDRLGNSLDRAMLLHAMLGSIGETARLARGVLTDEQAGSLLGKARRAPEDTKRSVLLRALIRRSRPFAPMPRRRA